MTLDERIALPDEERRRIARGWSPNDTTGIEHLLSQIVDDFRRKHPRLDVRGLGNVHGSLELVVMHPFIFDKRLVPGSFLGLPVKCSLSEPLPADFDQSGDYVWAPENYSNFVDKHAQEIQGVLGDKAMDRGEMLHALIGMPFDAWVAQCRRLGPGHTSL
jgi:hypothetical protein